MNADDVDNIALLSDTPTQDESQLCCLEQVAGDIGLHMNTDKMEFMYFKQGYISTQNGRFLKLVDRFQYFSNNVSSTEMRSLRLLSIVYRYGSQTYPIK